MNDCLFCKIIQGDIPARKVYEDDNVLAFLDIRPVHPGHTLLLPKRHARNILDMADADAGVLFSKLPLIARAVKEAVSAGGINIGMNNEAPAGQLVFHAHIHIIPRFENDGLVHWPSSPYANTDEEIAIAEKIIARLR